MLEKILRCAVCLKCKKRLNTPGDVIKHIAEHAKVVRRVLRVANCVVLVLPRKYVDTWGLSGGDEVEILPGNKGMIVRPKKRKIREF